jgi:hypothetical protein
MLDGWVTNDKGKAGWTVDFYNQSIEELSPLEIVASMDLPSTRIRINDDMPPGESIRTPR